jgi:hypothetical protein
VATAVAKKIKGLPNPFYDSCNAILRSREGDLCQTSSWTPPPAAASRDFRVPRFPDEKLRQSTKAEERAKIHEVRKITQHADLVTQNLAQCTQCPAGKYSVGTGASTCLNCNAGTGSVTAATSILNCGTCIFGKYSVSGSPCTDCAASKYFDGSGATAESFCITCASNSHSITGASGCACNAGTCVVCLLCARALPRLVLPRLATPCHALPRVCCVSALCPCLATSCLATPCHALPRSPLRVPGACALAGARAAARTAALAGATRIGSRLQRGVRPAQQLHGHGHSQGHGQQGRQSYKW